METSCDRSQSLRTVLPDRQVLSTSHQDDVTTTKSGRYPLLQNSETTKKPI